MFRRPHISKADLSSNWREPSKAVETNKKSFIFKVTAFTMRKKETVIAKSYDGPWMPFNDYKPGIKCELCKTTIRKAVNPQSLYTCEHVFCNECIHHHYNIKGINTCPTCKKEFDCDYDSDSDRDYDEHDYYLYNDSPYDEDEFEEIGCYCGNSECYGDCGVLRCGCIDVCRGRCGCYD